MWRLPDTIIETPRTAQTVLSLGVRLRVGVDYLLGSDGPTALTSTGGLCPLFEIPRGARVIGGSVVTWTPIGTSHAESPYVIQLHSERARPGLLWESPDLRERGAVSIPPLVWTFTGEQVAVRVVHEGQASSGEVSLDLWYIVDGRMTEVVA